ncbi:F-box protein [Glarea lozoyensis ATCC 20868]|uniref:F-box protein n=1 Tax=Glarea lozoyensis (strain ATCC 20868 / MF5171) TaxID=1116229 RepID=S3CN73_GLAL2|nr:F-box protein [Glarea lozoyensis ATCC 20868]EPE27922.1 F-box protein [Glarea lozoyensis ATCC 20868]
MKLLDLPLQILSLVVHSTDPIDFQALALSCRGLYEAAKNHIKDYNRLKCKFRHFTFDDKSLEPAAGGDSIYTSLQLIARIAGNPTVAQHIQNAHLQGGAFQLPLRDQSFAAMDASRNDLNILSLLERSKYLKASGLDAQDALDLMVPEILKYEPRWPTGLFATMVLLTLLPNVVDRIVDAEWTQLNQVDDHCFCSCTRSWSRLLHEIVKQANDDSQPLAGLSKLQSISPGGVSLQNGDGCVDKFTPLLRVQTLQSFKVGREEQVAMGEKDQLTQRDCPTISHLGNVLPASIQHLCLMEEKVLNGQTPILNALFHDASSEFPPTLSHLHTIIIRNTQWTSELLENGRYEPATAYRPWCWNEKTDPNKEFVPEPWAVELATLGDRIGVLFEQTEPAVPDFLLD